MTDQNLLQYVAICGLYCKLCAHRARIPQQASSLQKSLHEEGMDYWYQYVPELKDTFPQFWQFLQNLTSLNCTCRTGGGPPDCEIRQCAKQRKIDFCPQCVGYPCKLVQALAERYPMLIVDGKRLQKVGLERWVKEQEERAKRGVVYADIRYSNGT